MKKIAIFILTLIYITSASGATVNIHYCMGKFAGWELGHDDSKNCSSCGMDKQSPAAKDNCCKDEQKSIKVSDVHKSAQVFVDFTQFTATDVFDHRDYSSNLLSTVTETYPLINAPPGKISDDTFLFIRSIRI